MRNLFAFATTLVLVAACGKSPAIGNNNPDASPGADAPDTNGAPAFEIVSKDVMLAAGEQQTYCYYFHTPNTTTALVNKWVSDMSEGSHHAILFLNPSGNGSKADGTIDTDCSIGGQGSVWTYATQTAHQELDLPADDGAGKPLAQVVAANTAGFLQLHYLNATDNALTAHIDLKAYGLAANTPYTQTDAYVTYQYNISIPPNATGVKVSASCPLPQGVKFWTMSTHAHKQAVQTQVLDGTSAIFTSTDWEHPGAQSWMTTPFYTFTQPNLTWECTYDNTTPPPAGNSNITVMQGQSASTNEMCMATGYFFPSTGPKFEVSANGQCIGL